MALELAFVGAVLGWPPMRDALGTGPLPASVVALAALGAPLMIVADGVRKRLSASRPVTPAPSSSRSPPRGVKDVLVTDSSCNDAVPSFARSGIAAAAREAGAKVLLPGEVEKRGVAIPGKSGAWSVLEPYVRATKIINVPVAKHHGLARLTAGLKNWFGLVDGSRKGLHVGLAESIVGLAAIARPTLTVVDATRVLLRNGPVGGNLADVKRLDTIAVSFDPVAVDAWAATALGFDPAAIEHVQLAARTGLGTADVKSLSPVEITT